MCGIVGQYNFGGPADGDLAARDRASIVRMREIIAHRGPDDSGLWQSADGRVVLGHRRLSIVDVSAAGHQPMSNEDGAVWITFNGEIYNHAELRRDLRLDDRHRFRSRTDTEVLVHLYEERELGFVQAIDGMFAIALWDTARERLLLVRDRMGKKPIYYTVAGGRLLFASEVKALLEHPQVTRQLDLVALDQYLTFSNVPEPRTLFDGIHKLPAGHLLTCDRGGSLTIERYWSPLDGPAWAAPGTRGEAVERVRALVQEAVRKRLMADVPVGAFLSGGVDSSTNVALMSRLVSTPLQTFTIEFTGFGPSENFHDVPYARQVASMFGCRHTEVQVSAREAIDFIPEMVRQQDEPLGDPACLPMHFVSRAAHQAGIKVVLVGEGSDEVFCGYPEFPALLRTFNGPWSLLKKLPRFMRRAVKAGVELIGARRGARRRPAPRSRGRAALHGARRGVLRLGEGPALHAAGRRAMPHGAAETVGAYYEEILSRRPGADFSQQMSYVELRNRLPELLLMRVDKFSMAHSLEARAPFLDHQLATYALSLPASMKMNGTRTKTVLKDAAHAWLPADVVERKKQGFRVPLPAWLRGELAPWADEVLRRSPLRQLGLLDFDYIHDLWRIHREGRADHSFDLWCLINLSGWYEHWFAR